MELQRVFRIVGVISTLLPCLARADYFSYLPPGKLIAGSGIGKVDSTVHAPGIRFPVEFGPAYANSQVYRWGGFFGGGGSANDPSNFKYPWQDNFCETRGKDWSTPECPNQSGGHHQGQDIRPPSYADKAYWAVAVTNGILNYKPGDYLVELEKPGDDQNRRIFRYLHLDPRVDTPGGSIDGLLPSGTTVSPGMKIGKISNWFGGESTTIHLHFDVLRFVPTWGKVTLVSPYMSLVRSYETLIGYKGFTINSSVKVTGIGTGFLPVYGSTACGSVVGYRGETSVAVVLDGPVTCGGEVRWKVRFQDCLEGWVSSEWLKATGCLAAPVNPKDGASVTFPAQFTGGWTGDCRNAQLAFYNGQQGVSFSASSFYDQTITESYWSQNVAPVIGNGPTYYWSIGENFCGAFFTRTAWQSFQKITSCSAPMAFMAKRGLLPRALAVQCVPNSPTPTATRTATWTPTRTTGIPGAPSATPTRVPTLVPTSTRTITPTPTILQTATPTAGNLVFRDDFNRPDSAVAGNGWFGLPPSLFIQSNRLVGGGIVTRSIPFQFPVRLKTRFVSGGCGTEGGATNHFDHQISVVADQYGSGGYGIYFFRADESVSTSQIILMNGSVLVDRIYAPVEFIGTVDLDMSVFEDGSIRGVYRTQGIETSFSFPPRVMDRRGESLALRSYWPCPENFLAFDDLMLEARILYAPTPIQTSTPQNTITSVPSATVTRTRTATNTPGIVPSVTATRTPTRLWTATRTRTATLVPSPTATPTPTVIPQNNCRVAHAGSGCTIPTCTQAVCARDAFCCGSYNGFWDQSCANAAIWFSSSSPAYGC